MLKMEDKNKKEGKEVKKKPSEKQESKKDDKELSNEKESKTQWFVIGLVAFVIVLFVVSWSISESKKFEYAGLTFTKEKFNDIDIYTVHLVGTNVNADPINFKFTLRNDPRENEIPFPNGSIPIHPDRPVYLALNMSTDIERCGALPLISLGQFVNGMGHELITGVTEAERAEEMDRLHTNCDNNSGSTVLLLTESNETAIVVNEGNSECYEIRVNNCELEEAIEKVELGMLSSLTHTPL